MIIHGTLYIKGSTFLKTKPMPVSDLKDVDWEPAEPGQELNIILIAEEAGHYKFQIGNKQWFVFKGHCSFSAKQYKKGEDLPKSVNLPVPYHSQRNNEYKPLGTCNVTSVAMCLNYFGIKPTRKPQMEDELFLRIEENGWDRHVHDHLKKLFKLYGVSDEFTTTASWQQVKMHLAGGNPVIISGDFTHSGHIIVLRGYDEAGFWVNDPYGEWFPSGYQNKSGENLHYSYSLCYRVSYGGRGTTWAHFPSIFSSDIRDTSGDTNELPQPGIDLIKEFEQCYLEAYPDPLTGDKPITIGWGSTRKRDGSEWELGDRITQREADDLLLYQLKTVYLPGLKKIPCWNDLNINQQGALLSFCYNLGEHFFGATGFDSISRILRMRDWSNLRETFLKYRNPGSNVEDGLRRRRLAEADLFLKVDMG